MAISAYLDSSVKKGQYIVCNYYISQNGEDLLEEPKSTEKLLTKEQFSNIFFADVQRCLNKLKDSGK